MPVAECTFALEQVLEDLQRDPWPCQPDERVQRYTGASGTTTHERFPTFSPLLFPPLLMLSHI